MTMPSGGDPGTPEDAHAGRSGYDLTGFDGVVLGAGLSDLHNRTEENVRAQKVSEFRANEKTTLIKNNLWKGLNDTSVSLPVAMIRGFMNRLFPSHDFTTVDMDTLLDQVGSVNLEGTLTEHTEAIANLNDIAAATNTTVAYVGDLEDMVSFPRCDLVIMGDHGSRKYFDFLDGFGLGCSVTSHGHSFYPQACPTIVPAGKTVGQSIGHIYYSPIVVDRNGTVDKFRWVVGPDDSLVSSNFYEVALCVYNPANGNVEKVWSSGNITSGAPDTTTMQEVAISMDINQTCTPGQLLFGAHQQVAPGVFQNCRRFAAKPQSGIGRPGLLLDSACYVAQDYSQGIPSSISFASLTRENRFIPWVAVSVNA